MADQNILVFGLGDDPYETTAGSVFRQSGFITFGSLGTLVIRDAADVLRVALFGTDDPGFVGKRDVGQLPDGTRTGDRPRTVATRNGLPYWNTNDMVFGSQKTNLTPIPYLNEVWSGGPGFGYPLLQPTVADLALGDTTSSSSGPSAAFPTRTLVAGLPTNGTWSAPGATQGVSLSTSPNPTGIGAYVVSYPYNPQNGPYPYDPITLTLPIQVTNAEIAAGSGYVALDVSSGYLPGDLRFFNISPDGTAQPLKVLLTQGSSVTGNGAIFRYWLERTGPRSALRVTSTGRIQRSNSDPNTNNPNAIRAIRLHRVLESDFNPVFDPVNGWNSRRWSDFQQANALRPFDFTGNITLNTVVVLTALFAVEPQFTWFGNGTIETGGLEFGTGGAVSDFAFWGTALKDPITSTGLVEVVKPVTSGAVGENWTRAHWVITPPRGAKYMGVGGMYASMPSETTQSLYGVQSEIVPVDITTPSLYTDPREVQSLLRADRINWSENPVFINNLSGWALGTGTIARTADATAPSGYVLRAQVTAGSKVPLTHTISGLLVDEEYLVRLLVRSSTGCRLTPSAYGSVVISGEQTQQVGSQPVYVDMVIRVNAIDFATNLTFDITSDVSGSLDVLGILVEQTEDKNAELFHGNTPGDYFWETGKIDGSSRSYYYENFLARYKTVKGILQADTPMGIGVADPKFALPPTK